MYLLIRFILIFMFSIQSLNSLIDNSTYTPTKWPFNYHFNNDIESSIEPSAESNLESNSSAELNSELNSSAEMNSESNLNIERNSESNSNTESNFRSKSNPVYNQQLNSVFSNLFNLYKDNKNDFVQIDDDLKYDRANGEPNKTENSNKFYSINKSESEFRPIPIDPIVPIIKRMLRRKDIQRKGDYELKRRKGSYNDETPRNTNTKVYNDDDDHSSSSYSDDDEEDDTYYEDENYGKKSLSYTGHHSAAHAPLAALPLPLTDHYYTGSTGVPSLSSYWNGWNGWNSHGHYYPYYTHQPISHHGHHPYISKYGKHFYREEYVIIIVIISLAAFLALIFSLFMPYALIQSQAITGLPSNSIPYTNAISTLNGNQFSNAAVTADVNRMPINVLGKRRKRMINWYANQFLNEQLTDKNNSNKKSKMKFNNQQFRYSNYEPFDRLFNDLLIPNLLTNDLFKLVEQTTIRLLNNL